MKREVRLLQNLFFSVRECSSDGRAFVSHTKGKGIDTPHFHFRETKRKRDRRQKREKKERKRRKIYFYSRLVDDEQKRNKQKKRKKERKKDNAKNHKHVCEEGCTIQHIHT